MGTVSRARLPDGFTHAHLRQTVQLWSVPRVLLSASSLRRLDRRFRYWLDDSRSDVFAGPSAFADAPTLAPCTATVHDLWTCSRHRCTRCGVILQLGPWSYWHAGRPVCYWVHHLLFSWHADTRRVVCQAKGNCFRHSLGGRSAGRSGVSFRNTMATRLLWLSYRSSSVCCYFCESKNCQMKLQRIATNFWFSLLSSHLWFLSSSHESR